METDLVSRGVASGFAGGIGNSGAVCGAVAGAVMAIGLKLGRAETMEEWIPKLAVAGELRRRFEEEAGTIRCGELTGADLSTEEGIAEYMASDIPMMVCFPAVDLAYRLTMELLQDR